jgi:cytochrome P450
MSDVVFGAQYNLLGNERFRYVTECIDKSNVRMSALIQAPWYATLKLDKYLFRDAIKARNRFIKFVVRVIKDRMDKTAAADKATPSKREADAEGLDIFGVLAAARDPETGTAFNSNEIAAESTTLIVAGSDTSSTAMAGILFYLANNASAYAKAAEEVRAVFARPEDVCIGAALVSCTYLRACMDESLRMSPPVGSSLWREVVAPTGSVTIDGQAVPSRTNVGVSIYSLHHNAACYDQPFTYIPERWLGSGPAVDCARSAFTPFSIGTRGCLGKGLAQTEMLLTIARVLVAGDFRLADGELGMVGNGQVGGQLGREHVGEYQLWDHVTSQKTGPWLQFAARGE